MAANSMQIDVDLGDARREVESWQRIVGEGAVDAVDQIAVLAERFQKKEAPEGVGIPDVHLRTTIKATQESPASSVSGGSGYRKVVMPRKRTQDGWLLHRAIVGNPSTPTYTDKKPPAEPLLEWAETKLGERGIGWYLQDKIYREGHDSLPDRFIDRSVRQWEGRAEDIAQDAVESAFRSGGA